MKDLSVMERIENADEIYHDLLFRENWKFFSGLEDMQEFIDENPHLFPLGIRLGKKEEEEPRVRPSGPRTKCRFNHTVMCWRKFYQKNMCSDCADIVEKRKIMGGLNEANDECE